MAGPLVVVGDSILDIDLAGEARRLTPDAPAPVVEDIIECSRPGGAALAAHLAQRDVDELADVDEVVLVTAVGDDEAGRHLTGLLPGVRLHRLPARGSTAVKTRIRAGGQSLARLDSGGDLEIAVTDPAPLDRLFGSAAAILVADYGRGTASHPVVRAALTRAAVTVPLVWDPHPRGAEPVRGTRVLTPCLAEVGAVDTDPGTDAQARATAIARAATSRWPDVAVAVTLGHEGALLCEPGRPAALAPAPSVVAGDTCGAGDRFAASLAVGLVGERTLRGCVEDAVDRATAFVAAGGAASIALPRRGDPGLPVVGEPASLQDRLRRIRRSGGTIVATGGCFDLLHAGHVSVLRAARAMGDILVVLLNSDASVRRLKGPPRPLTGATERARILAELSCVDAVVIFDEDTPEEALRRVRPDVWVKGGDYDGRRLPEEDTLADWGGRVVLVPVVADRSTTRIVDHIRSLDPPRRADRTRPAPVPHHDEGVA